MADQIAAVLIIATALVWLTVATWQHIKENTWTP